MAKTREMLEDLNWEMDEMDLAEEAGPEDYIFVVKADGSLKAVMLPEEMQEEMSPGIKDLLDQFEASHLESSAGHTLH